MNLVDSGVAKGIAGIVTNPLHVLVVLIGPDVLLSHGYLKHYVWTLDFDDYRLYLEPVSPQ